MDGVKFDKDKLRYDLLTSDAMDEFVGVLTFGATKYDDRNWEKGMKWGRVIGATLRHTFAIMRGEDRDPETGLLHSAHVMCNMMFLTSYMLRNVGEDDRATIT